MPYPKWLSFNLQRTKKRLVFPDEKSTVNSVHNGASTKLETLIFAKTPMIRPSFFTKTSAYAEQITSFSPPWLCLKVLNFCYLHLLWCWIEPDKQL